MTVLMSGNIVTITASGLKGIGKSAVLGEIEIALRAIGLKVSWARPDEAISEKNLAGGEWYSQLEELKPEIVLVEEHSSKRDRDLKGAAA